MKKILLVAVIIFAVWIAGSKANAFEINGVSVDEDQVVLQTTYGGNITLERGQNAVPQVIKLCTASRSASIRDFRDKKLKFLVSFPRSQDFRSFSSFLRRTSDEVGSCYSSERCSIFVFF